MTDDVERELRTTLARIRARHQGVTRDQSNQLTFGDRCYAAGLAYAIGAYTGQTKDEVLTEFDGMFVIEGAPKQRRKLKRKTKLRRMKK